MKEQRKLVRWIREHKKALIIAGISIGTLIAIVLGIKNREAIKVLWASLRRKVAEKPAIRAVMAPLVDPKYPVAENVVAAAAQRHETIPFEVAKHLRNLPEGWHASPDKVATALEHGFELTGNQTWVDAYVKGVAA